MHGLALLVALILACYTVQAETGCRQSTAGLASMQQERIKLINDQGTPIELDVLVADDAFERASGFQYICPEVIERTLILFRYPLAVNARFHMQNVSAPLDIAFFNGNGKLTGMHLMQVYSGASRPTYGSPSGFRFALEARQGFFATHGISAAASYLQPGP